VATGIEIDAKLSDFTFYSQSLFSYITPNHARKKYVAAGEHVPV
jgi:hypothetical protein